MGALASCPFPLLNKWKNIVDGNRIAGFFDAILCSYSQIIFNDNSFSGLILIIATFCVSPQVGVGGLVCTVTAVIYLKLLKVDPLMIRLGVYGFCPALTGIIMASLIFSDGMNGYFFVFFVLAAIFCVTVNLALAVVFGKWDASGLGLPFGFTTVVFMAAAQPTPPPWEWLTRMLGPILSCSAARALLTTSRSKGPVLGVIWRKYWFRVSSSFGNCTPGKKSGHTPTRNWVNQP